MFPCLFKHHNFMHLIKTPSGSLPKPQKPLTTMAKLASNCLLLFLLSLLTPGSSGTLVGFSYNASGSTTASSLGRIVSFLESNKVPSSHIRVHVENHGVISTLRNTNVSVDLYLNENLVTELLKSQSFALSWMKSDVASFLPHVNIKSITLTAGNNLPKLLSALRSIHSVLRSFHIEGEVKVSAAFSLPFLKNMNGTENDFHRILVFLKKTNSFLIVEAGIDSGVKLELEDQFYKLIIQKVKLVVSILPCNDVPVVMRIKSFVVSSAKEGAKFADTVSELVKNSQVSVQIAEIYVDVSFAADDFPSKEIKREPEQIFPSFRREMLSEYTTISHDAIEPPVVYPGPINPVTTPPVTFTPDNPAPTIVTVPGTTTPTNPVPTTPLPIPSTAPTTFSPLNPAVNPAVPVTNPVTTPAPITVPGAQPVTNPATTYPTPMGNVPVVTPVTNPVAPPAMTNAPAIPGQSWCVARSGVPESALQSALDYACGMGGADCSTIQQGGSCYNPNSLQNHASYAFNSYYQRNPVETSCDFGGTAMIVSTNPSTGTCVYPSSATSSIPTPSTSTANPATTNPVSPVTNPVTPVTNPATTSPGASGESTGVPPSVLNSSNPASSNTNIFGLDTPPGVNPSASKSTTLQPLFCFIILAISFVAGITNIGM